jgi:hypothetical protein
MVSLQSAESIIFVSAKKCNTNLLRDKLEIHYEKQTKKETGYTLVSMKPDIHWCRRPEVMLVILANDRAVFTCAQSA